MGISYGQLRGEVPGLTEGGNGNTQCQQTLPPIYVEMQAIDKEWTILAQTVQVLLDRVSPFIRPFPTAPQNDSKKDISNSEFLETLKRHRKNIVDLNLRVGDLINNLEI